MSGAVAFTDADYPGYAEAVARESMIRGAACLGLNEIIFGLEVLPLNCAHLGLLSFVQHPFHGGFTLAQLVGTPEHQFQDGKPDILDDIMRFLWIVSPMYETGSRASAPRKWWQKRQPKTARDRFNEAFSPIVKEPIDKVVSEILEYFDAAFVDTDDTPPTSDKQFFGFQIAVAVELEKEHGYRVDFWNPDCPKDRNPMLVPLKIIAQLRKCRARNAGEIVCNRSERFIADGLAEIDRRERELWLKQNTKPNQEN